MSTAYPPITTGNSKSYGAAWLLAAGETGDSVPFNQYTDRSVQVSGVFGGATVRIEGSNDGNVWSVLHDPQGNDLVYALSKIEAVSEATLRIRPVVVGGDGSTALVIALLGRE